jgi:hypothetical protein
MRKTSNKLLWRGCEDVATKEIGPHRRSWTLESAAVVDLGALQRLKVFQLRRESTGTEKHKQIITKPVFKM